MTKSSSTLPDFKFFGFDFINSVMPFDFSGLGETHRTHIEIMMEMHQNTIKNMQAIGQRQVQIFSRIMGDQTSIAQKLLATGTMEEKVAQQTDLVNKSIKSAVEGWSELTDLVGESNKETFEMLGKHVSSTLTEINATAQKKVPKDKAA
jgi:phasin family protein